MGICFGKDADVARLLPSLLLASLAGCTDLPAPSGKLAPSPAASVSAAFDSSSTGRVAGRVTWEGAIPAAENFTFAATQSPGIVDYRHLPNPHDPRIDLKTRGLANAIVFLRGIPAEAAKPWDHPEASVELQNLSIGIRQGPGELHRVGFVKRGSTLTMQSKEPAFHNLRARGSVFFSLAFAEPDRPLTRTLHENGLVRFTSGAGYYWASAYLFVDDQPYYTRTDAEGRFTLTGVPSGPVEVVAWHPNRSYTNQVRDPETSAISRITFKEPYQARAKVDVQRQTTTTVDLSVRGE